MKNETIASDITRTLTLTKAANTEANARRHAIAELEIITRTVQNH